MSNEIATYSMIYDKLNLGTTGNECPTKTLILAISSSITITNESTYGSNECVRIDDINANGLGTSDYYFVASYPATNPNLILPASGSSAGFENETIIVSSYKISSGEFVNFTVTSCPDWLHPSIVGTPESANGKAWDKLILHADTNDSIRREGDIILTQNESGKTLTIHVTQEGTGDGDYFFYPALPDTGAEYDCYIGDHHGIVEDYECHYWLIRSYKGFGPTIEGEYIDFTVTSCPDWIRVVVDDNIRVLDDMMLGGHYYYKQILIIPQRHYDLGTDENPKIVFTQNETNEKTAINIIANLNQSQDESDRFTFVWSDETTSDKYLNIPSSGAYDLIFEEITSTYRGEVISDRDWKTEVLCMDYWRLTAVNGSVKDNSVIINAPQNINTTVTNLGVIVLLQKESNKALVVNVNQDNGQTDQYPYYILYSEIYDFSFPYNLSAGAKECAIHSYTISYDHEPQLQNNKNCTIISNPEWLLVSITPESWVDNTNTSETIYKVSIAPKTINDTTTQRVGDIVVQLDESGKTVTLHVVQDNGTYEFYSDINNFPFPHNDSGFAHTQIYSCITQPNVDPSPITFTVASKPDWVELSIATIPTIDGLVAYYPTDIKAVANTSASSRTGEVVFTLDGSALQLKWTIKLEGNNA